MISPTFRDFNLNALTGLRGIFAFMIGSGHFWMMFGPDPPVITWEYFTPVTLFFIMSGFTIASLYPSVDYSHRSAENP